MYYHIKSMPNRIVWHLISLYRGEVISPQRKLKGQSQFLKSSRMMQRSSRSDERTPMWFRSGLKIRPTLMKSILKPTQQQQQCGEVDVRFVSNPKLDSTISLELCHALLSSWRDVYIVLSVTEIQTYSLVGEKKRTCPNQVPCTLPSYLAETLTWPHLSKLSTDSFISQNAVSERVLTSFFIFMYASFLVRMVGVVLRATSRIRKRHCHDVHTRPAHSCVSTRWKRGGGRSKAVQFTRRGGGGTWRKIVGETPSSFKVESSGSKWVEFACAKKKEGKKGRDSCCLDRAVHSPSSFQTNRLDRSRVRLSLYLSCRFLFLSSFFKRAFMKKKNSRQFNRHFLSQQPLATVFKSSMLLQGRGAFEVDWGAEVLSCPPLLYCRRGPNAAVHRDSF